jgi:hypothetical protein
LPHRIRPWFCCDTHIAKSCNWPPNPQPARGKSPPVRPFAGLIAAERSGARLGTKSRTLAFPSLVATLTGVARGGDSNENVLPWSNGSVHAILASSCMDVAASSSQSARPNRRNTVLSSSRVGSPFNATGTRPGFVAICSKLAMKRHEFSR